MFNLLPIRELSPEVREILTALVLSPADKEEACKTVEDTFTPEKIIELIVSAINDDGKGLSLFEKIARIAASTYKAGFMLGLETYSETIEIQLRKRPGDSND